MHIGCVFAELAAAPGFHRIRCGVAGGAVEPRGEHGLGPECGGLAREDDEHGLRDLLGQMRIARLPHRRRVDKADVPLHEFGERRLGIGGGELAHQGHVIAQHHLYIAAERGNGQTNFGIFLRCRAARRARAGRN